MRIRSRVLLAAIASASLFAIVQVLSALATAQSQTPSQHVIVVFKNQDRAQPATPAMVGQRRQTLQSIQAPVLNQLSSSHARSVHAYTTFNAVSATVTPSAVSALKTDPSVAKVVPDQIIHLASPAATGSATAAAGATPLPGACPAPGKVQLNPQALQVMSVASDDPGARTARSLGATGAGVKVAFIADGLDINNSDFIRANGQHVFVDYKDFSGAGTAAPTGGGEAFEDASSIAAQGRQVYDVSKYSALPLNRPCNIRVEGVAPGASLVGLDIFGDENEGFNSSLLQAIDYAVSVDHVNVLNESLGINNYPDDQGSLDLIKQANDNAVAAGTTVTVSSGDAGVTNTVGSPSSDPNVIASGASTTFRTYAQDGYGGLRYPGITGWLNNNISSLSSGGFEQDGRTIDLVTPGESNWALCSTDNNMYGDCTSDAGNPSPVQDTGGTSESAPLTAGMAALVIQAYEGAHHGAVPSPALVKQLIVSNTDDIGAPADQQGAGLGDAYKAVLAARADNTAGGGETAQARSARLAHTSRRPSRRADDRGHRRGGHRGGHRHPTPLPRASSAPLALVDSATQLNAVDAPGTPESLTDTLTNASSGAQSLRLSTRTLGAYQPVINQTVTLSDSNPKLTDYAGDPDNYQTVTFHVAGGEGRLNASAAFQGRDLTDLNSRVRFFLIDPTGKYAGDSRPQGNGNYGNFQVAYPAPGTWTAVIHSRDTAHGGTTGSVLFGASVARYQSFGSVSPSFVHLGPGQSVAVTLQTQTPTHPGDSSGSIVIGSSGDGRGAPAPTSIPVTLRSLIPSGDQSFTDTLTGGNGRDQISGQELYYQVPLAAGAPELNATVTLADNPNNPFGAYLIDPNGQMEGYTTNMVPSSSDPSGQTNVIGTQVHVLNPAPGKWTLIVVFAPAVSGTALSEPFTVAVNQDPVSPGAGGLPNSTSSTLTAGHAYTYNTTIKNTGTAPESFFPDARLPGSTPFELGAVSGAGTTEPLTFSANLPVYLVPTNSTAINLQASTTGSRAIQFDSQTASGDPDIASTFGTTAAASFAADPVAQGAWDIAPNEYGPGGAGPGPTEPVTTSASVTTSPFDPAVSSPTGDLEADSANPATSLAQFKPITVGPGQTATIPVTITPTGASGSHVSGTLYLDDAAFFQFGSIQNAITNFPQGNQVAAIPYAYTIK
jgi:hypothetical protein